MTVLTLNRLAKEHGCLRAGGAEAVLLEQQQSATRAQLPHSVLSFHDRFAAHGKPSVVALAGSSCSACHLKLPSGLLGEVRTPGRYVMCPNCSVFVWSGQEPIPEVVVPAKKSSRKKAQA